MDHRHGRRRDNLFRPARTVEAGVEVEDADMLELTPLFNFEFTSQYSCSSLAQIVPSGRARRRDTARCQGPAQALRLGSRSTPACLIGTSGIRKVSRKRLTSLNRYSAERKKQPIYRRTALLHRMTMQDRPVLRLLLAFIHMNCPRANAPTFTAILRSTRLLRDPKLHLLRLVRRQSGSHPQSRQLTATCRTIQSRLYLRHRSSRTRGMSLTAYSLQSPGTWVDSLVGSARKTSQRAEGGISFDLVEASAITVTRRYSRYQAKLCT